MTRISMLRIFFLLFLCVHINAGDDSSPEVTIQQGKLRGFKLTSRKGREFLAFQRIPYAKSPVGNLRFQNPQPLEKWEGVLDATKEISECPQRNSFLLKLEITGEEDCLHINVYTPQIDENNLLDVLVYIHGGGWYAFSAADSPPQHFMDKDVVLVSLNYRLGPLGFLSTGDSVCPGNNGLKDQTAALKWVRDNIAAFGGNPESVTIFGESAGGGSVHYHVISPASKGLFHRAIAQSGTALSAWAFAHNGSTRDQAEKLATLLNCPTESSEDMVDCLRKMDAAEIIDTDKHFTVWGLHPVIPFKPVVETGDDAFIPEPPIEMAKKLTDRVPFMTGVTANEAAFVISGMVKENMVSDLEQNYETVLPVTIFTDKLPNKDEISKKIKDFYFGDKSITESPISSLVDLFSDRWFIHGADKAVRIHSKDDSAPVYYYSFTYKGSKSISDLYDDSNTDYGVSHADDLLYLFPGDRFFPGTKATEDDEEVIDTFITIWTNFARTGNPTPTPFKGTTWPKVSSPSNAEYVEIDLDGLHVKQGLQKERVKFWNDLPLGPKSKQDKDEL